MSNYRAPLRIIQTDWRAGETDPTFAMRVDSAALGSGAQTLENALLHATGAAARRPGTLTKLQLARRSRLIEFEFDANEKYIIAFSDQNLHIYDAAGTLITSFAGQPWREIVGNTSVWELNVIQKGDVMIIVHSSFKMRRLRRTGLVTFAIDTLAFSADTGDNTINQPFIRYAPRTVSLATASYAGGATTTVTANAAIFSAAWVGERIRIYNSEIRIHTYTSPTVVGTSNMQSIKAELRPAPMRMTAGSAVVEVTHIEHGLTTGATVHTDGVNGIFNVLAAALNGNFVITVIDSDHYTFTCGTVSDTSGDGGGAGVRIYTTSATTNWREQIWSDRRGWPAAITLHENRVWMGGSPGMPTFLAGSAVGDYYDFNVRDGFDDDSVQGIISATTRIVHLVSAKQLQIFCENSESVCETQNGEPITPGSFKVINHTAYGCDPNVRPRLFDGGTLFAQRSGKNVRKLIYDFNTDQQVALPVSIIASHMINKPNDVAVLLGTPTRPEQYAFFVNVDGTIACFHSIESEKLNAWTHFHAGGGIFDSVCVIGTSIFFSVLRDGAYWLERFELDATDIWLDGAVRLTGSGTTWNLGTRYANKLVDVMANGFYHGKFTVPGDGILVLADAVVGPLVAGYDYTVTMRPNPPDMSMTDGPMTGEKRRIVSSTVHFHQSTSAAVNGSEMLGFTIGQDPSLPPERITRKKRIRHLGYDRDPAITITQPSPGPLMVLGFVHEVSI